jgi:poly(A) polymerase
MEEEADPAQAFASVLAEMAPVAAAFRRDGKRLFLVGGIVRDGLLGRPRGDLDIDLTTDASPDEIESIGRSLRPTAMWLQGKRFGTIGMTILTSGGAERAVEITTHRSDEYEAGTRKPVVAFADDVVADLARRDFTVNAMAVDAQLPFDHVEVIDPFGGQDDLAAHRLRTPSGPTVSFSDDPLRMLRAARFVAKYDLVADPDLVTAIVALRDRLAIVSAERIRDELSLLLMLERPERGLGVLATTGLLGVAAPKWAALADDQRRAQVSNALAVSPPDLGLRLAIVSVLAGLSHDSARDQMAALKFPGDVVDDVRALVRLHRAFVLPASDPEYRRLVLAAGPRLDRFVALLERCGDEPSAVAVRRGVAELAAREDLTMTPVLDGAAVMDHLGLVPGRRVGEALAMLAEARLAQGPFDATGARLLLDQWWMDNR